MAASPPIQYKVVALQTAAVLAAAGALMAGAGVDAGGAALAGGGCAVLPNAFMALRSRKPSPGGSELVSAAGLFLAMVTKLGLTVLLLALALGRLETGSAGAFFTGFIVAVLGHHAAFLVKDSSHEGAPPPRPEPDSEDDW